MKIFLCLCFVTASITANTQSILPKVTFDTAKPELGYLVGFDSSNNYYVSRLYRIEIYKDSLTKVKQVYHWHDYDSSNLHHKGVYEFQTMYTDYDSEYKVDSVIDSSWSYISSSEYKSLYFQPAKTKKWKLGPPYELKPNEHYASYKLWYPFFLYWCE